MRNYSYSTAALLVGVTSIGVDALVFPSFLKSRLVGSDGAATTRRNLYLDTDGPNGHATPPAAAAVDAELFQRALLKEQLRLEGRLPRKGDTEELLHRALLQTRLEIEARERQRQGVKDLPVASRDLELFQRALLKERFRLEGRLSPKEDTEELLYRALLQTRLEIEARERQDMKNADGTVTPSNLNLHNDSPNRHQTSPTAAAVAQELFQRALLEERFRLEGRLSPKQDMEELLHRALLQTRLEIEARERQSKNDVKNSVSEESAPSKLVTPFSLTRPVGTDGAAPPSNLYLDLDGPNGFQTSSTASAVDQELFQRALLKERFRLEGRLSQKEDTEELFHRALLQTRLEIEARERQRATAVEVVKPTKKVKKFPWKKYSPKDVSSAIIRTFTPDKGIKELQEQTDQELVGFAASRLARGVLKGSTAAFMGLGSIFSSSSSSTTPPEPVVEAVADSTQSFVSAAAALATFGWRQGVRAGEYAKAEISKMEANKALEEARQLEENTRQAILEAERMEVEAAAAEEEREKERLAAEAKLEEGQRMTDEIMMAEETLGEQSSSFADEFA